MNNINILFVSESCKHSITLLKLLDHEKLIKYFKIVYVDDKLDRLPKFVSKVPCMVVSNINEPLIGVKTFEWVNRMKFMKQNIYNKNNNSSIMEYSKLENNSSDDKFAFVHNSPALPQSYFKYKSEGEHIIYTAPEHDKIKKHEQDKLIDDLSKKRNDQDNYYTGMAKKQQLNAILTHQKNNLNQNTNQQTNYDIQQMNYINSLSNQQNLLKMKQMQLLQNKLNNSFNKK